MPDKYSINASNDGYDNFDSGGSDDGDDEVNDTAIMIIEGSCPSVPNSMILKRELYLL